MEKKILDDRGYFLIKNIGRGFLYLAILVGVFLVFRHFSSEEERYIWFGSIYDNVPLVMGVFIMSEILFGIIPPEAFMLWAFETNHIGNFTVSMGILSLISYTAGFVNFTIGRLIKDKGIILRLRFRWIKRYLILFEKYGAYLVIVASVSPLPFAAIALLCGAGNMDQRRYLWFSLLRIVRIYFYGAIIYEVS
ncbi:VTT domain-containing protein [Negadavirga shengliensis]|uniref:VTT domain-containing protein n=1 Tax=Negadavirga shengliensis TaxID=1389218 RepID=A0ABV9SVR6_9BACT